MVVPLWVEEEKVGDTVNQNEQKKENVENVEKQKNVKNIVKH